MLWWRRREKKRAIAALLTGPVHCFRVTCQTGVFVLTCAKLKQRLLQSLIVIVQPIGQISSRVLLLSSELNLDSHTQVRFAIRAIASPALRGEEASTKT